MDSFREVLVRSRVQKEDVARQAAATLIGSHASALMKELKQQRDLEHLREEV